MPTARLGERSIDLKFIICYAHINPFQQLPVQSIMCIVSLQFVMKNQYFVYFHSAEGITTFSVAINILCIYSTFIETLSTNQPRCDLIIATHDVQTHTYTTFQSKRICDEIDWIYYTHIYQFVPALTKVVVKGCDIINVMRCVCVCSSCLTRCRQR